MKQLAFFATLLLFVASCKKKENPPGNTGTPPAAQAATGKISGTTWAFADGRVHRYSIDQPWFFSLYGSDLTDPCSSLPFEDHILFGMDSLQTGTFPLSMSGQTITFYDQETSNNLICLDGTLKINSIDTVAMTVSGEFIDAQVGVDNNVDGTFTVTICP